MWSWSGIWKGEMEGKSTEWADLPVDMVLEVDDVPSTARNAVILVDMPRVAHSTPKVNTEFRILVNGDVAGYGSTGRANGWDYEPITMHGFHRQDAPLDAVRVRVQYKTTSGVVQWPGTATAGYQQRRLTLILTE